MTTSLTLALLGTAACLGVPSAQAAPNLTVFGDSYSAVPRSNFPNWVTQLKNSGKISGSTNFAKSGTTAAKVGTKTFAKQISSWQSKGRPVGDYSVVYLGYNDIDNFRDSFSKSRSGYTAGVKALDAAGANLVLIQVHDFSTAPRFSGAEAEEIQDNTKSWNSFVRSTASKYDAVTVDLFKALGSLPKSYYHDDLHLGEKGQGLIARAISAKLGGSARVASTLSLSSQNQSQLRSDSDAGSALALAAFDAGELGLVAYPIGDAALLDAQEAPSDPTRAQFTAALATEERDGGAGFAYQLGQDTRLSLTIGSYGSADDSQLDFGSAEDSVRSTTTGFQLDRMVGALTFSTRAAYSDDRYETRRFDDLTGISDRAEFDGSTLELAQRVGFGVKRDGFTLTPWAELAYERQETDGFTISNPYLADQSYKVDAVNDTLGRIGLDLALDPIQVGEAGWLSLYGGLSYTHGISQDDYRIQNREAGLAGSRDETIAREATRSIGFDLGASLALGEQLSLDGGLSLDHDLNTGTSEAARVALSYRF